MPHVATTGLEPVVLTCWTAPLRKPRTSCLTASCLLASCLIATYPGHTAAQAGADSGSPSPAMDAGDAPDAPEPAAADIDIESASYDDAEALEEAYTQLMDELVQLRSRTAVIAGQLFTTRLRVLVVNDSDDDTQLETLRLTLDGAPVFQDGSEINEDEREVFEGPLAPGFHVFGVEVEQRQRLDRKFRYTLRDDFRFEVRPNTHTTLLLRVADDSDVAEGFSDRGATESDGEFEVHTEVEIVQVESPAQGRER